MSSQSQESDSSTSTAAPTPGAAPGDFPRGVRLLRDPVRNKGTAFTEAERETFGLRGLLPPRLLSEEIQARRCMEIINKKPTDLERYIYLVSLQDRNETLFYRVLIDHLSQLMPIIYTPTVGEACQLYGHTFRRPRGMWISKNDRGRIRDVLGNWPHADIRIIVVTDGERILGLGDLGADGMGIPVGKLALYSGCAGILPTQCLPITIDVGTNNEALRQDPMYIGLDEPRLRGEEYDALIDEFMAAVTEAFPKAIVQLEDFANRNAFRLLQKYRDQYAVFDDDIQGTGSVVLAGLLAAQRITGRDLADTRYLFLGAGEAGIGIAELIVAALREAGLTENAAREHCWFFDSKGLVVKSRSDLVSHKQPYAHDAPFTDDFLSAIRSIKPAGVIGVSGTPGTFTQSVVEELARINERPLVFALSNPTSKSECTAEQAYTWSDGRAVYASGSPFDDVTYRGRTFAPGQGNNAYIFPGVGLGAIVSEAKRVTDEMFFRAAKTLADQVTEADLERGRVYPHLDRIRDVSAHIAAAVAEVAFEDGLAGAPRPDDILTFVRAHMFEPTYPSYT